MTAADSTGPIPDDAIEAAAREIWNALRTASGVEWDEAKGVNGGIRLLYEVAAEAALAAAAPALTAHAVAAEREKIAEWLAGEASFERPRMRHRLLALAKQVRGTLGGGPA